MTLDEKEGGDKEGEEEMDDQPDKPVEENGQEAKTEEEEGKEGGEEKTDEEKADQVKNEEEAEAEEEEKENGQEAGKEEDLAVPNDRGQDPKVGSVFVGSSLLRPQHTLVSTGP